MTRLVAVVLIVAAVWWVAMPGVVLADAAGPTDYRTTITSVTPASDAFDVSVVGGDAFLRLSVETGHEVTVLGYDDEPYLRITEDGMVEQNRRSYATYYNEERYGSSDIPAIVDNDAPPEWERVGSGGSWAWHDHRAHWMGSDPPIGLEPGESLPPQIVSIVVDGEPVAIEVQIELVDGPSVVPVVFGAVIGLGLALLGVVLGPASTALVMLVVAAGALFVGGAQYRSLPGETGPLLTWWLLPAIAVVALVAAIATYGRSRFSLLALTAVAAAPTLVWAFTRRAGLTAAILPTDLPFGVDRFVSAAALAGSSVVLLATLRRLFAPPASPVAD